MKCGGLFNKLLRIWGIRHCIATLHVDLRMSHVEPYIKASQLPKSHAGDVAFGIDSGNEEYVILRGF